MQFMPCDVECQAADRRLVSVNVAAPRPLLGCQRLEERDRCGAGDAIRGDEGRQWLRLKIRRSDVFVLVESRQRTRVAACNAEGAIPEDAFVVDEVADDFLYRPLAGCVSAAADFVFVERR